MYFDGKGVEKNMDECLKYYQLSADQGNEVALFSLGLMYYDGDGVPQDLERAREYFQAAADEGHSVSMCNLGGIYYAGEGVDKDAKKAFSYYEQAAEKGDKYAQYNLGLMYYDGDGTTKDHHKARHFYELAAKQDHPRSQFLIGSLYYHGAVIEKDMDQAVHYLQLAVDNDEKEARYWLERAKHKKEDPTAEDDEDDKEKNYSYAYLVIQNDEEIFLPPRDRQRKEKDYKPRDKNHPPAPCKFWEKPGGCRQGDKCKFPHPGYTKPTQPTTSVSVFTKPPSAPQHTDPQGAQNIRELLNNTQAKGFEAFTSPKDISPPQPTTQPIGFGPPLLVGTIVVVGLGLFAYFMAKE